MHLAGHQNCGNYIIDTHDREVTNQVWKLFQMAYQLANEVSILLEWDGNIPAFDVYHSELLKSKQYMDAGFAGVENEVQAIDKEQISNPLNIVAMNQFL
jgi:uncharacterized protein (UPF0276 family)